MNAVRGMTNLAVFSKQPEQLMNALRRVNQALLADWDSPEIISLWVAYDNGRMIVSAAYMDKRSAELLGFLFGRKYVGEAEDLLDAYLAALNKAMEFRARIPV